MDKHTNLVRSRKDDKTLSDHRMLHPKSAINHMLLRRRE